MNKDELHSKIGDTITALKKTMEEAGAENVTIIYGYRYEDEQITGSDYESFINAIGLAEYTKDRIINNQSK